MKRIAFTLIELLVVIAIIAVLAAILFPVFAQAKSAAKSVACLSNCKQLALGLTMYAGDQDDRLPAATEHNGDAPSNEEAGISWLDTVQPYVKSHLLYRCPADPSTAWNATTPRLTSYGLNAYVSYNHPPYFGPTMTSFTAPSSTILVAELSPDVVEDHFMPMYWGDPSKLTDSDAQSEQWDPSLQLPKSTAIDIHGKNFANYPFADGHAKRLNFVQTFQQVVGEKPMVDLYDPIRSEN